MDATDLAVLADLLGNLSDDPFPKPASPDLDCSAGTEQAPQRRTRLGRLFDELNRLFFVGLVLLLGFIIALFTVTFVVERAAPLFDFHFVLRSTQWTAVALLIGPFALAFAAAVATALVIGEAAVPIVFVFIFGADLLSSPAVQLLIQHQTAQLLAPFDLMRYLRA